MGIIMIQPTAPMPIFGVVSNEARGHVVTTILIAMVANGSVNNEASVEPLIKDVKRFELAPS